MKEKLWRRFWRALVLPKKPKQGHQAAKSADNIRQYMLRQMLESRSIDYGRNHEDRAARLGRVVRLLHDQGWRVAVWSDGCLHIWDSKFPLQLNDEEWSRLRKLMIDAAPKRI